jgi:hypothetical protein
MNSLSGYDSTNTRTMGGNKTLSDNSGTIISNGNVSCTSLQVNGQTINPSGGGGQGLAGTITIGEVVKLPLDSNPTVFNSGSVNNAIFNFGIPTSGLTQAKLNSIDETIHNTEAINYNSATDTTSMSSNFACLDIAVRDIVCADMTIATINSCGGIVSCGNINVGNVVCGTIEGGNISVANVLCGTIGFPTPALDVACANITCGAIETSGILSTGGIASSSLTTSGNISASGGDITCTKIGDSGGTLTSSNIHCEHTISATNFSFTMARDSHGNKTNGTITDGGLVVAGGDIITDAVVSAGEDVLVNNRSVNTYLDSVDTINSRVQYLNSANNSSNFTGNVSSDTIKCQTFLTPTSHAINIGVDGTASNPNYINIGNFSGTTTNLNGDVNTEYLTCKNYTTPASRVINIGTDATYTNQNTINIGSFTGSTINLRGAIIMTDPDAFFFGQFISQFS